MKVFLIPSFGTFGQVTAAVIPKFVLYFVKPVRFQPVCNNSTLKLHLNYVYMLHIYKYTIYSVTYK